MSNLNNLLQSARELSKSGDDIEAAKIYNQVFVQQPNNFEAAENLGLIMARQKKFDTAEKVFLHMISLWPKSHAAHGNLGNVYLFKKEYQKAVSCIKAAVEIDPNNIIYKINLGKAYMLCGEFEDSIKILETAEKQDPNNYEVIECLANLYNLNNPARLHRCLTKLYDLSPTAENYISKECFVPNYFNDQNEIDEFRKGWERKVDKILNENLKVDITKGIFVNTFYLTYHNRSNAELKKKFAAIFQKFVPELNYTAPHCINYKRKKSSKIKLGFASAFLHKHPVSICFSGLIEEMIKDERFEIDMLYFAGSNNLGRKDFYDDIYYKKLSKAKKIYIYDTNYIKTRDHISSLELDAIIYWDLGMYWIANYTAFARLAPIQAFMPGHPDTSGIENIDYYLTCADLERDDAQNFYSEEVVKLKNIPTCIIKPNIPEKLKARADLNLPADKKIYYCPMKNHKFHPDFDIALKQILDGDKNAVILIPKDSGESSDIIEKRIERHIGSEQVKSRIIYHRWASCDDFLSYLSNADVVLDTFYFGAGTTLYFAFAVDAPVLTLPGLLGGGRAANAIYKQMGVTDLIAKDKADYVHLAIKCANDEKFRTSVKKKINSNKEIIYNNTLIVPEIAEFVISKLKAYEA